LIAPVGAKPSLFSSAVKKLKYWNIQYYGFAFGSVWSLTLGKEQGAEEDI
jgi:hypothetical protein